MEKKNNPPSVTRDRHDRMRRQMKYQDDHQQNSTSSQYQHDIEGKDRKVEGYVSAQTTGGSDPGSLIWNFNRLRERLWIHGPKPLHCSQPCRAMSALKG